MKTVLIPHTQTPSSESHRATPRRRTILGIILALGVLVGCTDPDDPVTYTVTFNTDGGTAVAAVKVKSGEQVKRPTPDPTKEDHKFVDWYAGKGFSQRYDFATPVTKNITLSARWRPRVVFPTALTIKGDRSRVAISTTLSLKVTATPPDAEAGVLWTIADNDDENNSKGTIDANGLYTAPARIPNPDTVTVKATSTVAPTISKTYELTVILLPPTTITITGDTVVNVADSTQLRITPNPTDADVSVTWSIEGNDENNSKGTINHIGSYRAPATLPIPATVIVAAVSEADPEVTDTHVITIILPPTHIAITGAVTLGSGTSSTQLGITPTPLNADARVTWTIADNDENNSKGTITATGGYTAPNTVPTPATVIVEAVSEVDPEVTDTHAISIVLTPTSIAIGGANTVSVGGHTQLGIDPTPENAYARVTWSIVDNDENNGKGTIDTTGIYTAPASIPNPATVTIKAISAVAPAVSDTHEVTLVSLTPTHIAITGADTVSVGSHTQLGITSTPPNADARVTWTIVGNDASNSKGTIDTTGLYTAPNTIPTPDTVIVEAVSVVAPMVRATHKITITSNIPDANFRAALKIIIPDAFTGDRLDTTHADVTERTELDVSVGSNTPDDEKISNLRGIEYFTSLTLLFCNYNKLTALDISANTSLATLSCSYNLLTELALSANNRLTGLNCDNNRLTALALSANTSLVTLRCHDNQLTGLDISANTSLTGLKCFNNDLTTLDMRGMRRVATLTINAGNSKNPITTLKVHVNLKDHDKIKEAKTNRGGNITIMTYTAAAGSTVYTEACPDYNPNANTNKCTTP